MTAYSGQVPDTAARATDWLAAAACNADPEAMFPDNNEAGIDKAKRVCGTCPVWRECLAEALRTGDNEHGIRGGLKPVERRALAKKLARRAGKPPEPEPVPERTLQSLWEERTQADGEHLLWAAGTPVSFGGRNLTPQRIGFRLGRGREPVGTVRKTCDRDGCVLPAHLGDQRDRDRKRTAAYRAARAAEREAVAS